MSSGVLKTFYNSKEWKLFRQQIILDRSKNDGIYCEKCGKKIVNSKSIQVHHIEELTEENYKDVSISLNPDNVLVWCQICHNIHHGRYHGAVKKRKEKSVYIVYGPPMSGKAKYVIDNMEAGDIVVDMDRLYKAVSLQPMYSKPDNLRFNVFSLRNILIDNIKTRYGNFRTAWIIGGYADKYKREQLAKDLGAELILMQSTKEECKYRLDYCNDYRQDHKEEWSQYIDKWFEDYTE